MSTETARSLNPAKLAKQNDDGTEPEHDEGEDGLEEQLEAIESIQQELDSLNDRASEEILRVEQKYNSLRKPHFAQRTEEIAKVPDFWFTAMLNQPVIVERITEKDEEALRCLKNIEVQEFEDIKSGYRILFEFSPNPFFENDNITKEFILVNESGEPTSTSTPIRWKSGMDLTVSPAPAKGQKRARDAGKSFFTWFSETQEEGADEIGEAIKDELWTNPLPFFLNDAVIQDEEGDEQYEDEEESGEEGEAQEVVVVEDDEDEEEFEEEDGGQSGRDPPADFEEEGEEEADVLEGEEDEGDAAEGDEELLYEPEGDEADVGDVGEG